MEAKKLWLSKVTGAIFCFMGIRARLLTALLCLFVLYSDILAFKIPFFSLIIFPCLIFIAVVLFFTKGRYDKKLTRCIVNTITVFFVVSIVTLSLARLHDYWIMERVRDWGKALRAQKNMSDRYSKFETRFIHGYRAVFIHEEQTGRAVIIFNKFGQIRQSYSITDDIFLEEKEL